MEPLDIIRIMEALSSETRYETFMALLGQPDGMAVSELAFVHGVANNTMSNHLQVLNRVHLVSRRRQQKRVIYKAEFKTLEMAWETVLGSKKQT
jgi:DNA-binding transcriptional ArsR family regulator